MQEACARFYGHLNLAVRPPALRANQRQRRRGPRLGQVERTRVRERRLDTHHHEVRTGAFDNRGECGNWRDVRHHGAATLLRRCDGNAAPALEHGATLPRAPGHGDVRGREWRNRRDTESMWRRGRLRPSDRPSVLRCRASPEQQARTPDAPARRGQVERGGVPGMTRSQTIRHPRRRRRERHRRSAASTRE